MPPPVYYSAIFNQVAPFDTDDGWREGVQYPRITFQVFRSLSVEQILKGTAHFQVYVKATDTSAGATLRNNLMGLLNNMALLSDEGLSEFEMATETPFDFTTAQDLKVIGLDIACNFTMYVTQTTFPPDPIAALSGYVAKNLDSDIQVMPTPAQGSDSQPLLYWRTVSDDCQVNDKLIGGEWHHYQARGHVLCPGAYARLNWAMLIAQNLNHDHRLAMNDGSPLMIYRARVEQQANPFTQGQIVVEGRYGVLAGQVPRQFVNAPIDPITGTNGSGSGSGGTTGGGTAPPPPIPPPIIPPPVFTPQAPYVSDIDTHELLTRVIVSIVNEPTETGPIFLQATIQTTDPKISVNLQPPD